MALSLHPKQIVLFLTAVSPLLLAFFLVIASLFNQDVKGLVYLGGVLLGSIIWFMAAKMSGQPTDEDITNSADSCNILDLPYGLGTYTNPNYSSYFIAFTMAYLVLPMYFNDQINWAIFIFLLVLFFADAYSNVVKRCTSSVGTFFGAIIGLLTGTMWFTVFHSTGNDSLLYFQELLSNRVFCQRPKKQTFKCSVYKNGELVSSEIM